MKTDAMRPLTVSLTPKQLERLAHVVESGAYASNSEVIRDALRLWEMREERRELEIQQLRAAVEEGLKSGPLVDGPTAMADIKSRLLRKHSNKRS